MHAPGTPVVNGLGAESHEQELENAILVMPAEAGVRSRNAVDSRFRGNHHDSAYSRGKQVNGYKNV